MKEGSFKNTESGKYEESRNVREGETIDEELKTIEDRPTHENVKADDILRREVSPKS
jgi:hypothetical protein